jgi:hypothetical protein
VCERDREREREDEEEEEEKEKEKEPPTTSTRHSDRTPAHLGNTQLQRRIPGISDEVDDLAAAAGVGDRNAGLLRVEGHPCDWRSSLSTAPAPARVHTFASERQRRRSRQSRTGGANLDAQELDAALHLQVPHLHDQARFTQPDNQTARRRLHMHTPTR